jgi:hypothetical protein
MNNQNWFQKKWGVLGEVPTEVLLKRIEDLKERVTILEQMYKCAIKDIVNLEEENVETTNTLYEIMHDIDAVDARIDILHTHNNE